MILQNVVLKLFFQQAQSWSKIKMHFYYITSCVSYSILWTFHCGNVTLFQYSNIILHECSSCLIRMLFPVFVTLPPLLSVNHSNNAVLSAYAQSYVCYMVMGGHWCREKLGECPLIKEQKAQNHDKYSNILFFICAFDNKTYIMPLCVRGIHNAIGSQWSFVDILLVLLQIIIQRLHMVTLTYCLGLQC